MNHEEYTKVCAEIEGERGMLRQRYERATEEYLAEVAIPNGTHVRVCGGRRSETGVVRRSFVRFGGIGYEVAVDKKDGSVGNRIMKTHSWNELEIINSEDSK